MGFLRIGWQNYFNIMIFLLKYTYILICMWRNVRYNFFDFCLGSTAMCRRGYGILRNVKYTNLWLKPTCKLGIRAKISIILWRSFNKLPLMSKWVKCGIISRGFKSTIWFFEVFNTRSFFNFEHDLGSNTTFWWGARSWWSTCNSGIEL